MALFCDFENVALGVRDANYEKFDIKPVLERLLLKGSIVVKKAYCDWERYKGFKATMHEANFELIEIPHVRQSGKNSADIRLVVDALDLCYTKSHVNTFVIISGDSDFSPLVSKLRENNKQVIGVGVKQSTSDLLVANCDEFIFYDDLVRESRRAEAKRDAREGKPVAKRSEDGPRKKEDLDTRKSQAIEIAVETFDALFSERGDSGKIWASVLKEAIKRRKPDFSESYYGYRTFGNLLEDAQARGLLQFGRDEKSGAYVYRSSTAPGAGDVNPGAAPMSNAPLGADDSGLSEAADEGVGKSDSRRGGRGGRNARDRKPTANVTPMAETMAAPEADESIDGAPPAVQQDESQHDSRRARGGRKASYRDAVAPVVTMADMMGQSAGMYEPEPQAQPQAEPAPEPAPVEAAVEQPAAKAARKPRPQPARKALNKPARKTAEPMAQQPVVQPVLAQPVLVQPVEQVVERAVEPALDKPKAARKPAARPARPRKPKADAV